MKKPSAKKIPKARNPVEDTARCARIDSTRSGEENIPLWLYPAVLVVLGLVLYGRSVAFDFVVWDDGINIYENPLFKKAPLSELAFFWSHAFHKLYIPLTYTSWAVAADFSLRLFGRLDPSVFHGLNTAFHIFNSLLVYELVRNGRQGTTRLVSALAAAVFLLHPMQVEAVAWVTGFKDVFSATWALGSLLVYIHAGNQKSRGDSTRFYAAAWLLFWAALLAKPSHVFLGGVFALLEWQKSGFRWNRTAALRAAVFFLPALAAILWTRQAQEVSEGMRAAPLWLRPWVALDALTFYFCKTLFPHPISIDYGRSPLQVLQSPWIWATAAAPLLGFWVLWKSRWRESLLPGVLFWGLALSPSIGLMPFYFQNISTVADRYQYVALAGFCLVLAALYSSLGSKLIRLPGLVLLTGLLILSSQALSKWKNSGILFRNALEQNPQSWLGHVNYGSYLVENEKGEGALAYYQEAMRLNPTFFGIRVAMGQQLLREGKKREALEQFQVAARLDPENATVRMNLGIALVQNEQTGEATAEFEKALSLNPEYYEAWINYGQILAQQKRGDEAEAAWRNAIQIDGDKGEAYDRLAQWAFEQGQSIDARNYSQKALQHEPGLLAAHVRLASLLRAEGRTGEAIDQLRKALGQHPDSPEILNNLAWYLATRRASTPAECRESVQLADRAVGLLGREDVDFLETLAVAHAAAGDFVAALGVLQKAEKRADSPEQKKQLRERRRLFEAGKQYWIE